MGVEVAHYISRGLDVNMEKKTTKAKIAMHVNVNSRFFKNKK